MDIFPEVHTNRLKLRRIQVEDIPSLLKYANNKKISDHIVNMPHPYQEPEAVFRISYVVQGFKSKVRYVFAITLKEQDELIGEVSLHLENSSDAQLGYWVGEPFWNKGIGTEAVEAILKFGFEKLNLHLIQATCHIENKASAKILLHNGMAQRGATGHLIHFLLKRQDYEGRQTAQS